MGVSYAFVKQPGCVVQEGTGRQKIQGKMLWPINNVVVLENMAVVESSGESRRKFQGNKLFGRFFGEI